MKATKPTVTLVRPEDVRHFKGRELTEDEMRAVLGDEVFEMLRDAPKTARATVTAIDRVSRTITVGTTSAKTTRDEAKECTYCNARPGHIGIGCPICNPE